MVHLRWFNDGHKLYRAVGRRKSRYQKHKLQSLHLAFIQREALSYTIAYQMRPVLLSGHDHGINGRRHYRTGSDDFCCRSVVFDGRARRRIRLSGGNGALQHRANGNETAALVLNILVAVIGTVRFYRAGFFSWQIFWPFVITSIPASFIGGALSLPVPIYKSIVGLVLLYSAVRLFFSAGW